MKFLASLLLTIALASCSSFAPNYPPGAAAEPSVTAPAPTGPSAPRKAYGVARETAGAVNTARTLGSLF